MEQELATFLERPGRPIIADAVTPLERMSAPMPALKPGITHELGDTLRLIFIGMLLGAGWMALVDRVWWAAQ